MLEAYHKLNPKPKSTAELEESLQVIWDSLPQEPINKTLKKLQTMTEEVHKSWWWTVRHLTNRAVKAGFKNLGFLGF